VDADSNRWEERGPHPVGVRTIEAPVAGRGASVPVEVWYPAAEQHRGRDLADDGGDEYDVIPGVVSDVQAAVRDALPAEGSRPGVVFSHGMAGHRRQSTFLCTHLASHGFVVAAPDHVGNTLPEMLPLFLPVDAAGIEAAMVQSAMDRPGDVVATIDALADAVPGVPVDTTRVAAVGHSFGGWTVLAVVAGEPRVAAVVGLAPGGGRVGDDTIAGDLLDLDWGRAVPTLLIAAEHDTVLPLDGIRELAERLPGPATLLVLENADHYHFCDDAGSQHEMLRGMGLGGERAEGGGAGMRPFAELCTEADAERVIRSRAAAHLGVHLLAVR
jgi:predicted dienelactone hydrolase